VPSAPGHVAVLSPLTRTTAVVMLNGEVSAVLMRRSSSPSFVRVVGKWEAADAGRGGEHAVSAARDSSGEGSRAVNRQADPVIRSSRPRQVHPHGSSSCASRSASPSVMYEMPSLVGARGIGRKRRCSRAEEREPNRYVRGRRCERF
jgi:hypothetical protein